MGVKVESGLPWDGNVAIHLSPQAPAAFSLHLRMPSWTGQVRLRVNGQEIETAALVAYAGGTGEPASGYAPQRATYLPLARTWSAGDMVEIAFEIPVAVRKAHRKVKGVRGRVALTRGPLAYCLESVDNPGLDLFETRIDPSSVRPEFNPDRLGGVWVLRGETRQGQAFTAIPYALWANRGESQMAVWMRA